MKMLMEVAGLTDISLMGSEELVNMVPELGPMVLNPFQFLLLKLVVGLTQAGDIPKREHPKCPVLVKSRKILYQDAIRSVHFPRSQTVTPAGDGQSFDPGRSPLITLEGSHEFHQSPGPLLVICPFSGEPLGTQAGP